jgi:hypothetical protein
VWEVDAMTSKLLRIFVVAVPVLLLSQSANAQGEFKFLGNPRQVPDQFTPRYGIRFNTQGYDQPLFNVQKKTRKMTKKGVPDWAQQQILQFPGTARAFGVWIDDAFDKARQDFLNCGGDIASRATRVPPRGVRVTIMPSAFYEPYWKIDVAGAFYPSSNEIKVLNIYYTWSGTNKGWLRHARDLLVWEMGNYIAYTAGIRPEPRDAGWPCNAPKR